MSPLTVVAVAVALGCTPLVVCSVLSIRRWGAGLWMFSPLVPFLFAYAVAFGFVPAIEIAYGIKLYPDFNIDEQSFWTAEALGAGACWSFSIGFLFDITRQRPRPDRNSAVVSSSKGIRLAALEQKGLFVATIAIQIAFGLYLLSINSLTLNFQHNRQTYLVSLLGSGYINMFNQLSCDLLMLGMLFSIWTRRVGKVGFFAVASVLGLNLMVTNRGLITSILYLVLFAYFLRSLRSSVKVKPFQLVAVLGVILALGAGIGLIRSIGADEQVESEETPVTEALRTLPPLVGGFIYLSNTFDMGVLLERSIQSDGPLEWGSSWAEDVAYTFVPRSIFPDKPVLYGSTRLQNQVAPEIYGGNIDTSATFPIGIFGEAYVNFGILGVICTLFFLGFFLRNWFSRCLAIATDQQVNWTNIICAVMYASVCSHGLNYIRSLGGFMALVLFMAGLLILVVTVIRVVAQAMLKKSHTPILAQIPP